MKLMIEISIHDAVFDVLYVAVVILAISKNQTDF